MKIAVLVWGIFNEGGTQRQALNLARQLKLLGHSVSIGTFFYGPVTSYSGLLEGIEIAYLYGPDAPEFKTELGHSAKWWGKNFIFRFLVVKYRTSKFSSELAKRLDATIEVINPHDGMYRTALNFQRLHSGAKTLWMANDIHSLVWTAERFEKKVSFFQKFFRRAADYLESKRVRSLNKIVVLDELNKKVLKKYYGAQSTVVRSGVDAVRFDYSLHQLSQKPGVVKLLLTGILAPHRRYQDVFLALKMLKAKGILFKLDIVGRYKDGDPYKKFLDQLIAAESLGGEITFMGAVPEEKLLSNYHDHHIFIFPNHNQTWGLVVFEAMACGLPVIVSRTCGASEVLTDGINAMLVDPKAPEQIFQKILDLINDPELYSKLSSNGSVFVRENITWEKYATEMFKIMQAALEG